MPPRCTAPPLGVCARLAVRLHFSYEEMQIFSFSATTPFSPRAFLRHFGFRFVSAAGTCPTLCRYRPGHLHTTPQLHTTSQHRIACSPLPGQSFTPCSFDSRTHGTPSQRPPHAVITHQQRHHRIHIALVVVRLRIVHQHQQHVHQPRTKEIEQERNGTPLPHRQHLRDNLH